MLFFSSRYGVLITKHMFRIFSFPLSFNSLLTSHVNYFSFSFPTLFSVLQLVSSIIFDLICKGTQISHNCDPVTVSFLLTLFRHSHLSTHFPGASFSLKLRVLCAIQQQTSSVACLQAHYSPVIISSLNTLSGP